MYSPDQLNSGHKTNPIYRSSVAPENGEHHQQHKHHHQHENVDYNDGDFGISNIQITPSALMSMCPALLVQIEQGSCSDATAAPIQQPTPRKEIKEISSFGKAHFLFYLFNKLFVFLFITFTGLKINDNNNNNSKGVRGSVD